MKYLIASDIHGNEAFINYLYQLVDIEKPDKIILLGDLVSSSDASNKMLDFLRIYKDILVAIRGNMDFPITDGLLNFYQEVINGKTFIFTHGHLIDSETFPCDVYVQGHTHINAIENGKPIYFNPGSLSLPRGNSVNSYGLITDTELIVKDTDGNIIKELTYR